jgi:hypothetical protein
MKKGLFLCALGAGLLLAGQSAHADTFSLSFGGTFVNGTSFASGSNGSGGSDITFSIAGTPTPGTIFNPNTYAISDLNGTVIVGGTTYTIGSLDNNLGGSNLLADNLVGFLSPDVFDFDLTASGTPNPDYTELLIDYNFAEGTYDASVCNRNGKDCRSITDATTFGADIYDISTAPNATPEPGSLALLGTSILGGAGLLRRRFIKA